MSDILISSLVFMLIFAIVVITATVIKVKKAPEKFMKQTEDINNQISNVKTAITGNSISWEEAKKQAALELEMEEKKRAERKAAKIAAKEAKKNR